MLVHRFHVIYVEVPSGHPGVDDILAEDKKEALEIVYDKRIAVIGITEAK